MNILVFGATGMVGQMVLHMCLQASDVTNVTTVGRSRGGVTHPRLVELVTPDLTDLSSIEARLGGFDACFFCLGVSSVGMKEADYTRLTYDLTLAIARVVARLNPGLTFTYVSGTGTDSTERGSSMWARVKGRTENALRALPFKAVFLFRPGVIQPLRAVRSKTALYRVIYTLAEPFFVIAKAVAPQSYVTGDEVGLAMLHVARAGYPKAILEVRDIKAAARG